MTGTNETSKSTFYSRWLDWLAGHPRKFHRLVLGRHPDYLLEGFTASRKGSGWIVIVRGLRTSSLLHHVCFGAGDDLPTAFRNVALAIEKDQWRGDKFHPGVL